MWKGGRRGRGDKSSRGRGWGWGAGVVEGRVGTGVAIMSRLNGKVCVSKEF